MRRLLFCLILVLFLFTNICYAAEVNITLINEKYYTGETFQAKIEFLEEPIEKFKISNIKFQEFSSGFLYKEFDNFIIVSATLPENKEGNFTLVLDKLKYLEGNTLVEKSFSKTFTIENKDSLKITPYIEQDGNSFSINVKNNADSTITANIILPDFLKTNRDSLDITSGNDLNYFIEYQSEPEDSNLNISYNNRTYIVPLIYFSEKPYIEENNTQENITTITPTPENKTENKTTTKKGIQFNEITDIDVTLKTTQIGSGTIKFTNYDPKSYFDIKFLLTGNLKDIARINKKTISELKSEETEEVTIYVNEERLDKEGIYEGYLSLEYNEEQLLFPVKIVIYKEKVTIDNNETDIIIENITEDNNNKNYSKYLKLSPKEQKVFNTGIFIFIIILLLTIGIIFFIRSMKKQTVKVSKFEDIVNRPRK